MFVYLMLVAHSIAHSFLSAFSCAAMTGRIIVCRWAPRAGANGVASTSPNEVSTMLLRHLRFVAPTAAFLLSLAPNASAVVLWDQSNWNTLTEGSLNLSSNSCSAISGNTKIHTASDVHFDSP